MSELLLQTKLFKPALRPALINRTHLINRLNDCLGIGMQGFAARLALVCAPAGFGKTTLVSAWLAQLTTTNPQFSGGVTAWLSLDESDNDPVRFLTYLIAALQTAVPGLGETAVQALQSPQPPPHETILTLLINDISQNDQPIILVLDDYHVITTPAIHQALTFLLEHLPPQLHLLLTSRSDPPLPLSRLRARGQVIEIRANDLRFKNEETSQFLNQVMGLSLDNEALSALAERTEGWIAGLQLAAVALQSSSSTSGRDNLATFIASFSGSHRFILDYLTDEVLERRPTGTRRFLLQTAVLDRFCASLCNAVTGEQDCQTILEQLEQANLFLIPLDDQRHWYRYHHLFAELLQQRLRQEQPGQLPDLHRRSREWFEQNELMDEAIHHGLAEGNFERVASLIERIHDAKWQTGEIKTLQGWLAALPIASWGAHPRLWLVQAWADMTVGEFSKADEKLRGAEEALALLDEETARRLRPEVMAFRASYASLVQDPHAVEWAQQALQELSDDYWMRGMLVVFLSAAYYVMGDLDAASDALAQAPGSSLSTFAEQPHQIHLLAFGGMVYHAKGRLQEAWSLIYQALELAEPGGKPIPFVGTLFSYMAASLVLYEQDELEQAQAILNRCVAQAVNFGSAEVHIFALSGLARICLARDDLAAATNYYNQIDTLLQAHTFTSSIMAYVDYHRFQLLLKQGSLASAAAWVESHTGEPGPLNAYAFHRVALPQLLIAWGDIEPALDELAPLIQEAHDSGHGSLLIKALALQALAFRACDNKNKALTTIENVLTLAEPEGYYRVFLDEGEPMANLLQQARQQGLFPNYTDKLLAAFDPEEAQWGAVNLLPEPLSEREMEVLRLVATGTSNKDIADQLFIALSTAKKHVSNMLVKLDAPNRTQAAARARELGLLP